MSMSKCLHMNTVRTSISLPEPLAYRLRAVLKKDRQTLAGFITRLIERELNSRDEARLKSYAALDRLTGSVDSKETTLSTTMNDVLYGDSGAWRGDRGE